MPVRAPAAEEAPALLEDSVVPGERRLLVATYNIHSGLGSGRGWPRSRETVERNLRAVADDLSRASGGRPLDAVALNEVDFRARRSAWIDEAAFLAAELGRRTGAAYRVVRGETWSRSFPGREAVFGNALLVPHPVLRAASCRLDVVEPCAVARQDAAEVAPADWSVLGALLGEPRGVVKATLSVDGRPVDVLATHLDAFAESAREMQAAHLLERFVEDDRTTVLLGDMNAVPAPLVRPFFPTDRTAAILTSGPLADPRARLLVPAGGAGDWATFPAVAPLWPLDWVLASHDLAAESVRAIGAGASDHLGLYATFRLVPAGPSRAVASKAEAPSDRRLREDAAPISFASCAGPPSSCSPAPAS